MAENSYLTTPLISITQSVEEIQYYLKESLQYLENALLLG